MRRWIGATTVAVAGVAALLAAGVIGAAPAHADLQVCGIVRLISAGTFLQLDQTECQYVGLPSTNNLPVTVPALLTSVPVPLPAGAVAPPPDSSGLVCVQVHADVPGIGVATDQGPCVPFDMPTIPGLPPQLTIPSLSVPPLPVTIPGIPLVPPLPVPIPVGGLPYPL